MGTYLSTPVVEKGVESGDCLDDSVSPLVWALVDMQGWRKSMEDAHVAETNVAVPPHLLFDCNVQDDTKAKVFGVFDGHGGAEVARFCQLYLVDVLTKQTAWKEDAPAALDNRNPGDSPVGHALVQTFHALDRMIDDRSRRDELIRLRTSKPQRGERRTTTDTNPIPPVKAAYKDEPVKTNPSVQSGESNQEKLSEPKDDGTSQETKPETESDERNSNSKVSALAEPEVDQNTDKTKEVTPSDDTEEESGADDVEATSDEDSTGVVGINDADELEETEEDKLESNATVADKPSYAAAASPAATPAPPPPSPGIVATIIQNGRQICNLPDHPIHAGCTAIVAVLIGRVLTIANAGDSRAVLCRAGGRAEALSYDHKPHQDREMSRITKSGGFVNQFGRVNGNLNLSRSIGDLKYKQIPGLTPAEQMITAEPDIVQVTLHPQDEFIVLGCDGIWDCLSNDQAVKYVRDRIDTKSPTQIGIEMLDEIISEDPRATQGIGGDNMTIMIVDLQPSKRAYR